jgi:hypothetical protein
MPAGPNLSIKLAQPRIFELNSPKIKFRIVAQFHKPMESILIKSLKHILISLFEVLRLEFAITVVTKLLHIMIKIIVLEATTVPYDSVRTFYKCFDNISA